MEYKKGTYDEKKKVEKCITSWVKSSNTNVIKITKAIETIKTADKYLFHLYNSFEINGLLKKSQRKFLYKHFSNIESFA